MKRFTTLSNVANRSASEHQRPSHRSRFSIRSHRCGRFTHRRRLLCQQLERRRLLTADASSIEGGDFETDPRLLEMFFGPVLPGRPVPPIQAITFQADQDFPVAAVEGESEPLQAAPFSLDQTFHLHSRPDSNFTIYLDFDGHTTVGTSWNSGYNVDAIVHPNYWGGTGGNFSNARLEQIQKMWQIVAEDFAPFDVNVTTEEPLDLDDLRYGGSSDTRWGTRVVLTKDTFADCSCGGHAYLGSFDDPQDEPALVYNGGLNAGSESISHEVGHALGLSHDGSGSKTYYSGHGSGDTSWGPIMGSPFSKTVTQWSHGDYFDATRSQQDDLEVITRAANFPYNVDDHSDQRLEATPLQESATTTVNAFGIIERNDDVDWFRFVTGGGDVNLDVDVLGYKPNLDVWVGLYDADGNFVSDANSNTSLSASFQNLTLPAGEYFIKVDGVARDGAYDPVLDQYVEPDPPPYTVSGPQGYSDYGSLGQYRVTGTVIDSAASSVSIVADQDTVAEGDDATFTITASDGGNVEVVVAIRSARQAAPGQNAPDGTEPADFGVALTQTVSVLGGSGSLVLPIVNDSVVERDEVFEVVVTDAATYAVADRIAVTRVLETESSFGVSADQYSVQEGDLGSGGRQTFTVRRYGSAENPTVVGWRRVTGGSLSADASDFASPDEGTVAFQAGQRERSVEVDFAGDIVSENTETYAIELFIPDGESFQIAAARATAQGRIVDDESVVSLASSAQYRLRQVAFDDGDFDHWAIDQFVISGTDLHDDFDPDIDATQWAAIENAMASDRFPGSQGNALFFSGATTRSATTVQASPLPGATIDFEIVFADTNDGGLNATENGEDAVLEFSLDGDNWTEIERFDEAAYGAWTPISVALPPDATFAPTTFGEGDAGTQLQSISIPRTGFVDKTLSLDWAITPTGTHPVSEDDFVGGFPSGTVSFGSGESSATIEIPVVGDLLIEDDETFLLTLSNSSGGPITSNTLVGVIANDDFAAPEIQVRGLEGQVIVSGDLFASAVDGTDFGLADVDSVTVARQFVIENIGVQDLTLSSIAVAGVHADDFQITQGTGVSPAGAGVIAPGEQATVEVTFDPLAPGNRNAELLIQSDDPDESTYRFAITGQATDLGVQEVVINDGRNSRSQIQSVRVVFNQLVYHQLLVQAFQFSHLGQQQFFPSTTVAVQDVDGRTEATITFEGRDGSAGRIGTQGLIDGYYQMRIRASAVLSQSDPSLPLYEDFVFGTDQGVVDAADSFFRLFGDDDGDGDVDGQDFGAMVRAFPSDSASSQFDPLLDFDRDGDIDSRDLASLRIRLGKGLSPSSGA